MFSSIPGISEKLDHIQSDQALISLPIYSLHSFLKNSRTNIKINKEEDKIMETKKVQLNLYIPEELRDMLQTWSRLVRK